MVLNSFLIRMACSLHVLALRPSRGKEITEDEGVGTVEDKDGGFSEDENGKWWRRKVDRESGGSDMAIVVLNKIEVKNWNIKQGYICHCYILRAKF